MNKLQLELKEVSCHYNDMTTSDLQGVVQAIAMKYNTDEELCLNYVYGLVE